MKTTAQWNAFHGNPTERLGRTAVRLLLLPIRPRVGNTKDMKVICYGHVALLVLSATLGTSIPSYAQIAETPVVLANASESMSDGEVRKIDRESKKITLKHGPIKNLDMPAMTMVFQVRDPAMLDTVQPGDKIRFSAERSQGAIVVTHIEVTP